MNSKLQINKTIIINNKFNNKKEKQLFTMWTLALHTK